MMLEAVYVDVPKGIVVALEIKPAFKPLFRAWLDNASVRGECVC
jgi:hypothetical protein